MKKIIMTQEISPADRVKQVNEYYFSRKQKEISELNKSGLTVINLGIGSPDFPPSRETVETLYANALKADAHGYQPYTGINELRAAYSEWYGKWYGVKIDPAGEILPLIGSKEGILHISLAFLNPGDAALVPNPGYPTYTSVTKLVGARVLPYELKEENGWFPDFEALESMDLTGVKLMWMNYPNMPTGANVTREQFARALDFGKSHGILIVNDNPYSFILNDHPLSILSIPGAKEHCIELNSLSKSHNMPGWRMGMLISSSRYVEWVLKVKSNIDSGQFKPMQYAAIEALKATREWHDAMNAVYASRRDLAGKIMSAIGCTYDESQVGLFLWGRLPDEIPDCHSFSDTLLHNARVFITPGEIFGSCGSRYMRISLCSPQELLSEALERIKAATK
jgi:aspartate/methionine/tyrosine aminotransferase